MLWKEDDDNPHERPTPRSLTRRGFRHHRTASFKNRLDLRKIWVRLSILHSMRVEYAHENICHAYGCFHPNPKIVCGACLDYWGYHSRLKGMQSVRRSGKLKTGSQLDLVNRGGGGVPGAAESKISLPQGLCEKSSTDRFTAQSNGAAVLPAGILRFFSGYDRSWGDIIEACPW